MSQHFVLDNRIGDPNIIIITHHHKTYSKMNTKTVLHDVNLHVQ